MPRSLSRKKILLLCVLTALSTLLVFLSWAPGPLHDIQKGSLQYSQELGWINWDHARPTGPSKAYAELVELHGQANDSFLFTYRQEMVLPIAGVHYVAEVAQEWRLPHNLSKEALQEAFMHIFVRVSTQFEEMQGQGAYARLGASRASSFREGDLVGNLLSVYCAFTNQDLAHCRQQLSLSSTLESLQHYRQQGCGTHHWNDLALHASDSNPLLKGLQALMIHTKTEMRYGRMTAERERFYSR